MRLLCVLNDKTRRVARWILISKFYLNILRYEFALTDEAEIFRNSRFLWYTDFFLNSFSTLEARREFCETIKNLCSNYRVFYYSVSAFMQSCIRLRMSAFSNLRTSIQLFFREYNTSVILCIIKIFIQIRYLFCTEKFRMKYSKNNNWGVPYPVCSGCIGQNPINMQTQLN